MTNTQETPSGLRLQQMLCLTSVPVAISFLDTPPADVPRVASAAVSGCTYWKMGAQGSAFFTEASDHHTCPIGAYTHGIDLPPEPAAELGRLLGMMTGMSYLREHEIPDIPRRAEPFRHAVYAPWGTRTGVPDVVLVSGSPRQIMLLAEAALAAGVSGGGGPMGRPTCATIPFVMSSGCWTTNLGCIGNRVYTDVPDQDLYFAMPGARAEDVLSNLRAIEEANFALEQFHRERRNTAEASGAATHAS